MTLYCGIDNGLSGAIVAIDKDLKVIAKYVMPIIKGDKTDFDMNQISKIFDEIKSLDSNVIVALEKAHVRPVQGIRAAFTTGLCYGMMQAMLSCKGMRYIIVNPSIWMKEVFQGQNSEDKKASVKWCQQMFPNDNWKETDRCKNIHTGLSDAVAIAYYCRQNQIQVN